MSAELRATEPRATEPRMGWMFGVSMWMLPVVIGAGWLAWLGFVLAAILARRTKYLGFAALYGLLAAAMIPIALAVDREFIAGPINLLWMVSTLHAVVANARILATVWARRTGVATDESVRAVPDDARPGGVESGLVTAADSSFTPHDKAAAVFREHLDTRTRTRTASFSVTPDSVPDLAAGTASADSGASAPIPARPDEPTAVEALLGEDRVTDVPRSWTPTTVLPGSGSIDPRVATEEQLAAVPGIGPERAAELLGARQTQPVNSVAELANVLGLSAYEVLRATPYLRFPSGPPTSV